MVCVGLSDTENQYSSCNGLRGYQIAEPPFSRVPFERLTKDEARIRFEWFLAQIPLRLKSLCDAVGVEQPRLVAKLNFTPESLVPLGEWFIKHVHARKLTKEEMVNGERIIPQSLFTDNSEDTVDIRNWVLTDETISLSFDIGIYMAKIFENKFRSIRWTYLTERMHATYPNEPILDGIFGQFSPFREVLTFSYSVNIGQTIADGLRAIYESELKFVLPSLCSSLRNYEIVVFPFADPYGELHESLAGRLTSLSLREQMELRLLQFKGVVKERLWKFHNAVAIEDPDSRAKLDYTSGSLVTLEEWLKKHIHKRRSGGEEIGREEERINNILASKYTMPTKDDFKLTAETISLCFDSALYLSKIFHEENRDVRWMFVDLHRLILEGFITQRNPFDLVLAFANEEPLGKLGRHYLKRMYECWTTELTSIR